VVHESDPPSPWAGYRRCLEDLPTSTHLLIVQDDAVLCRNFAPAVQQIAQANPEVPVCLFLAKHPRHTSRNALKAAEAGERYVDLWFRDFCPVVAMLWPTYKAREFSEWAQSAKLPGQPHPRSDDAVVGRWMIMTRTRIRATVPSIVDHRATIPSVKGTPSASSGFTAQWFCEDGLEYDWSVSERI